MTYLVYVVAAYSVFLGLLVIDALGSLLRLRRARQLVMKSRRKQLQRDPARNATDWLRELTR
ncbi:heme exporter protein CcmD [Stenotrophomonas sp. B1-1]|uniref:heme exporter protein CcmD n=1 Tax=Stenotrophomonas sp. B1-1 TaxID=2710648 RepID=UPI0013DD5798|nr:heme exporter protein CcmD [Stenotrophomonas sp. B1-1]